MIKMIKGLFVAILLFTGTFSYGQFGLYASAAYISVNGTSAFYNNTAPGLGQDIGSISFQGTDFGLVQQNSGNLKLVGGEIKTFKGISDNVCSGALNYTIYPVGARPVSPVYNSIDLGFYSDCFAPACGSFFGSYDIGAGGGCCSDRDQKWQNPGFGVAANIDLTTNPIGTYNLEVYYSYTGEDAGNSCGTTKFDNNNNNPVNYTATFIITPIMPVSFGTIRVVNNQTSNKISWNTFSEANTNDFIIERSANGVDFYSIGKIPAAGFSSIIKEYSFIDQLPVAGINYYRIKMREAGSRFQNSVIVSTVNRTKNSWYVINNPANNHIKITGLEKQDQVIIYNAYGAEMARTVSGNTYINIPCGNFADGAYFIKLINSKGFGVLPIIIAH